MRNSDFASLYLNGLAGGVFRVAVPNFVTAHLTFEFADLVLSSLTEMTLEDILTLVNDMMMKK